MPLCASEIRVRCAILFRRQNSSIKKAKNTAYRIARGEIRLPVVERAIPGIFDKVISLAALENAWNKRYQTA